MSIPFYDGGVAAGLLSGVLFGYALEAAGFGSPRKLTAQFSLRDFSVFKVMFTAVLVSAIGLYILRTMGLMAGNAVFIPTLFFWAILAGGLLIGAGVALGGYCPGTSVVGVASGRIDAVLFGIGMVLGTSAFAWVYEPLTGFYMAAQGPAAQTLPQLFGLPEWAVLLVLVILAAVGFRLGTMMERARGGPLTAAEVCAPDDEADDMTMTTATRQA
jgi:hypothetical protein